MYPRRSARRPPLADGSGKELHLRCVLRPDGAQAALLERLGLRLPERLRMPALAARMWCRLGGLSHCNKRIGPIEMRRLG